MRKLLSRIAGLGFCGRVMPTPVADTEAGMWVNPARYDPTADNIADAIAYPGKRWSDSRRFRHELAVYLQEQVLLREHYDEFLEQLLASEPRS